MQKKFSYPLWIILDYLLCFLVGWGISVEFPNDVGFGGLIYILGLLAIFFLIVIPILAFCTAVGSCRARNGNGFSYSITRLCSGVSYSVLYRGRRNHPRVHPCSVRLGGSVDDGAIALPRETEERPSKRVTNK